MTTEGCGQVFPLLSDRNTPGGRFLDTDTFSTNEKTMSSPMNRGASRMTRRNTTLSFRNDLGKFIFAHVVAPIVMLANSCSIASVSLFKELSRDRELFDDFVNLSNEVGNLVALRGILDNTSCGRKLDFGSDDFALFSSA